MNEKDNVLQLTPKDFKRALQAQDNPWRETEEYSIGAEGIFIRTVKTYKNGVEDVKWVQIHPFPLMPIESVDMLDSDIQESVFDEENQVSSKDTKTYTKVRFLDLNGQERFVKIPQSELSQISKQSLLAKRWPLPPANKMSKVADIMLKVLADGRRTVVSPAGVEYEPCIKITSGSDNCGWVNGEHIKPGHPRYVGDEECMTFKAGKAEIQIDILGQWYAQDEQLALIAAHQLVGYTFGNIFSPSVNLIIELTGDPGDGKSVRLIAQSSYEGIPIKGHNILYFDATASIAGMERLFPLLNSGSVLLDEFDKIVNNKGANVATEMIFMICNGTQRVLAEANDNKKARKIKKWSFSPVVASNKPIVERLDGHESIMAIKDRIWTIHTCDEEILGFKGDLSIVNVWRRLLEENYGHIYGIAIDYIKNNRIALIKKFEDLRNELYKKEYGDHYSKDMRDAEMIASLQLGADLVSEIFGEEAGLSAHRAVDVFKRRVANTTFNADNNYKIVIERFKEWIADNIGSIRIDGFAYTGSYGRNSEEQQLDQAERLTNNAIMSNRGAIAGLEQSRPMQHRTDFEGCIWLKPEAEASLKKSGIAIDELMKAAKELDLLPKTKRGELIDKQKLSGQKKDWLENKTSYAIKILLYPFPEEEDEVNNEFEDEVFYSNVDRDDIDSLVEQNINAHMFDLPKID